MKAFTENKVDRLFLENKVETQATVSFTVRNKFKSVNISLKKSNATNDNTVLILAYLFDRSHIPTHLECFPIYQ